MQTIAELGDPLPSQSTSGGARHYFCKRRLNMYDFMLLNINLLINLLINLINLEFVAALALATCSSTDTSVFLFCERTSNLHDFIISFEINYGKPLK